MYKLLFALLMTVGMTTAMCAQQKQKMNSKHSNSKILVAYFSATGTTARAAEKLVEAVGGDLYPIAPAQSYTSADLDWNNKQSRSSVEMNNPKMRPAIKSKKENIGTYDVVFIGYPIWWYQMPMAMYSFFDKYDFDGKTIIPFSTHGGSGWSGTLEDIAGLEPNATMVNGYSISRNNTATSRDGILNWLQEIGMVE